MCQIYKFVWNIKNETVKCRIMLICKRFLSFVNINLYQSDYIYPQNWFRAKVLRSRILLRFFIYTVPKLKRNKSLYIALIGLNISIHLRIRWCISFFQIIFKGLKHSEIMLLCAILGRSLWFWYWEITLKRKDSIY